MLFVALVLIGVSALLSLLPPSRKRPVGWATFFFTGVLNEQPYAALALVGVAAVHGTFTHGPTAAGALTLGVAIIDALLLAVVASRNAAASRRLKAALAEQFELELPDAKPPRTPLTNRIVPLPRLPSDVELIRDLRYGPSSSDAHLLDLYRPKDLERPAPVFIHWHGGAFRSGGKSREALPLFYHLARRGYITVSPNYRLVTEASFPASHVDAKRAIDWVRRHGSRYGADGNRIIVAGSSAGGHIASMCGLTQNDPRFQPGFEQADTTVSAVVSLYGYYGPYDWKRVDSWQPQNPLDPWAQRPTAPLECDARGAPPFLILHGDHDGVVPVWVARRFVDMLRESAGNSVVYLELPGARHAFDTLPSVRLDAVTHVVERYLNHLLAPTSCAREFSHPITKARRHVRRAGKPKPPGRPISGS